MKGCEDYSATIHTGHDKELSGPDLEEFLAHLTGCETCRKELEAEESLSSLLQRSRPLYTAPDALRARIILAGESLHAPVPFTKRIASVLPRPLHTSASRAPNRLGLVAAILIISASLLPVPAILRQVSANSYVEAAIAAHRGLVDASLPLEIQSASPSSVTAWFAGKVPFNFRIPSSHEQPEAEQVYRLIGGRLVNYKGGYVALVAYQMQQKNPSGHIQQLCSVRRGRGNSFRWNSFSLQQRREPERHHLEQPRTHVCSGLIIARFGTAVLPGVPPESGGSSPIQHSLGSTGKCANADTSIPQLMKWKESHGGPTSMTKAHLGV